MKPLAQHIRRSNRGMSPNAEILLDMVSQNKKITVMNLLVEAIDLKVATQATLHKELYWLVSNGYVNLQQALGDKRTKECTITPKGKLYLIGVE